MAVPDRADIVIGKVVGHGKRVNRGTVPQERPRPAVRLDLAARRCSRRTSCSAAASSTSTASASPRAGGGSRTTCSWSTPTSRPSASPCWPTSPVTTGCRARAAANASLGRFDAEGYFDNVREVLDLVEDRTEPGEWRDRVMAHWYRGKMLGRVGGRGWLERDADYREELYGAVRRLALERYDESVHERMASTCACAPSCCAPRRPTSRWSCWRATRRACARTSGCARSPGRARTSCCKLESKLGGKLTPLRFERREDGRVLWVPPERLRGAIADADRDVTDELGESGVQVVPARTSPTAASTCCPPAPRSRSGRPRKAGRVRVRLRHHGADRPDRGRRRRAAAAGPVGGARRSSTSPASRTAGGCAGSDRAARADDLSARGGSSRAPTAPGAAVARRRVVRRMPRLGRAGAQADAGSSRRSLPGLTAPRSRRTARRRSRMPACRGRPLLAQVAQQRPHAGREHRLGLDDAAALEHVGRHALRVGHHALLEDQVVAAAQHAAARDRARARAAGPVGSVPTRRQIRSGRWRAEHAEDLVDVARPRPGAAVARRLVDRARAGCRRRPRRSSSARAARRR